jgi:hypothetical protein
MGDKDKMVEKLTEKLTKMVSRRGILASLSAGAIALASGLLGYQAKALVRVQCCLLCKSHNPSCGGCACSWAWSCTTGGCRTYRCIECYSSGGSCNGSCTRVKCSKIQFLGNFC